MLVIFNPTIIPEPEIEFREQLWQGIFWLEWYNFEVVQSTPEMLTYPGFSFAG